MPCAMTIPAALIAAHKYVGELFSVSIRDGSIAGMMIRIVLRSFLAVWIYLSTAAAFLPARSHSIIWQNSKTAPLFSSVSTKANEEELIVQQVLAGNSLFKNIPEESTANLIDALERKSAQRGEVIVHQGDSCIDGYVYVIAEGSCRVLVDGESVPEPYGILEQNTVFGEMGILYDEVRAATVMVESESLVYYQLAGDLFKAALSGRSSSLASLEKMQEIDEVINVVSGTNTLYDGKVIPAYQPERTWLWQQYAGTVLKISRETILFTMAGSALFVVFAKLITNEPFIWESGFIPPDSANDPLIKGVLSEVNTIWGIQKTLTTFVLTFFVNQSFRFWGDVYKSVREVQGKLSSFNLLLVTNVIRTADGSLTPEAEKFLDEVGQCTRLFHILFWASKAKRFSILMSDEGLKRMESRGLMSSKQLDILLGMDLPNDQLFSAPLEWMLVRCNQAADDGVLMSDTAAKGAILKEFMFLRNAFANIGNTIEGR